MTTDMAPRRPWPFPTAAHHPPADPAKPLPEKPTEEALDHGIEESFPASDPVAVTVTTVPNGGDAPGQDEPKQSDPPARPSGGQAPPSPGRPD